jgi:hypothetical protein
VADGDTAPLGAVRSSDGLRRSIIALCCMIKLDDAIDDREIMGYVLRDLTT